MESKSNCYYCDRPAVKLCPECGIRTCSLHCKSIDGYHVNGWLQVILQDIAEQEGKTIFQNGLVNEDRLWNEYVEAREGYKQAFLVIPAYLRGEHLLALFVDPELKHQCFGESEKGVFIDDKNLTAALETRIKEHYLEWRSKIWPQCELPKIPDSVILKAFIEIYSNLPTRRQQKKMEHGQISLW